MSQCKDILSIDEDFEDAEHVLHPSLMAIATSVTINTEKRKAVTPGTVAQWGRA
jgi:hypothetical protein